MKTRTVVYVARDTMNYHRRQILKLAAGPVPNVHDSLRQHHADENSKQYQKHLRTVLRAAGLL